MDTGDYKRDKGFTLIEIIAVLVILGILAVVAVPKYLSMVDETRIQSAQAAIAEIKARLASAQAKYMIQNSGIAPNSPTLFSYATSVNGFGNAVNLANMGNNFTASVTTGTPISISITAVGGQAVNVTGNFSAAGD